MSVVDFLLTMVLDEKTSEKIQQKISEGNFSLASKLIAPALKDDPDNVGLLLDYGFISTNLHNYEAAEKTYVKVTELVPDSASGFAGLGFTYRIQGKNQDAIEMFKKGIKISPENAMIHFELGEAYFDLDKYEDALKSYYEAIKFSGEENDAEILHRIAQVHLGKEEPDKAMEIAQNVLKKDPSYGSIYNIMGLAAYMKEKWAEAKDYFSKYLKFIPDDDAAISILEEIEVNLK